MKLLTEQIISVGAAVGVVCLFIVAVYLPQQTRLHELHQSIQTRQDCLSQAKQKTSGLVALEHRIQSLRTDVDNFDRRLTKRSELGALLEKIVANLNDAELVSQEIRPQSPATMPRYSELPVSMTFTGSFQNTCAFLAGLEEINNLIRITDLSLDTNSAKAGTVKAKVILTIYCDRS